MNVCLISTEFMGCGKAGGFGFATRSLGRELASRGVRVTVVLPQPRQVTDDHLTFDAVTVRTYPRLNLHRAADLLRECNADVYHSQEPSLATWIAQRVMPDRLHVVTSRDPRTMRDWMVEWWHPSLSRAQVAATAIYYENMLTRQSVRRARRVFVPARCLADRVRRKYRLPQAPAFLPTPVRLPPASTIVKAAQPTVCVVGRLDRRKRPEVAMALAPVFPDVRFIVAGAGQDEAFTRALQHRYAGLPNVDFRGFVDQFAGTDLSRMLSESWILLSTSIREGLPNSFIEACGHGCAILSAVDPDGFATRFGYRVTDGNFVSGLHRLLAGNAWQEAGARGCEYVRATNAAARATDRHLQEYCRFL